MRISWEYWIDLRENLQETMVLPPTIGFPMKFPVYQSNEIWYVLLELMGFDGDKNQNMVL